MPLAGLPGPPGTPTICNTPPEAKVTLLLNKALPLNKEVPFTPKVAAGEVEPMPTLPAEVTVRY